MFLLLLLLLASLINALQLHVSSSTGDDDSGDGSIAAPFKTFNHAFAVVQSTQFPDAVSESNALLLNRGDLFERDERLTLSQNFGQSASFPFILGAYGDEQLARPVIKMINSASNIVIRSSSSFTNKYIEVRDIVFLADKDVPRGERPSSLYCGDSINPIPHDISFIRVVFKHHSNGPVNYCANFLLHGCQLRALHNLSPLLSGHSQGFYSAADNLTMTENEILLSGKYSSWFDHNVYISHSSNVLIERNFIHSSGDGIKLRTCHNVRVRYNVLAAHFGAGAMAGGDDADSVNVVFESNLVVDNHGGLLIKIQSGSGGVARHVTIFNNILVNHWGSSAALTIANDVEDVWIAHNTFPRGSGPAGRPTLRFTYSSGDVYVLNNLFVYDNDTKLNDQWNSRLPLFEYWTQSEAAGFVFESNAYYRLLQSPDGDRMFSHYQNEDFESFDAWRAARPLQDQNSVAIDALVADLEYRSTSNVPFLSTSSAARSMTNKNASIVARVPHDITLRSRSNGVDGDAGAVLYASSSSMKTIVCNEVLGYICDSLAEDRKCPGDFFHVHTIEDNCCVVPCGGWLGVGKSPSRFECNWLNVCNESHDPFELLVPDIEWHGGMNGKISTFTTTTTTAILSSSSSMLTTTMWGDEAERNGATSSPTSSNELILIIIIIFISLVIVLLLVLIIVCMIRLKRRRLLDAVAPRSRRRSSAAMASSSATNSRRSAPSSRRQSDTFYAVYRR